MWIADARQNLAFFLEYESRCMWKRARHLELLCEKLEAVERGEILRLIITMPPRHGKSEVASKKFPAWFLGRNPEKEMIISSYGADLAYDLSRLGRETLREWGPELWGVNISKESGAVGRWGIEGHRGGLVATGVGGPITGRGAHVAIIDDPFKNDEEANSATYREKVWNWYLSTLRTRLAPNGSIVLIQTRWHEDDLAGRLIKEMKNGGEEWEVLNLPALAEEDDPLGRQPGEALWPDRFDEKALTSIKRTLGIYWWSALYQQSPRSLEGKHFKRQYFRYYTFDEEFYILHLPDGKQKRWLKDQCFFFQTCDPAGSTKTTADYFVLGTWAVTPQRELLLRDIVRERLEGPDQPALFRSGFQRWQPVIQGVEPANMGLTLFQTLQRMGLPLVELKPDKDKVTRALPMAARYEVGAVYHLQGAPWLDDYEDELIGFPNMEYDDQVDMASYAAVVLARLDALMDGTDVAVYEDPVEISPI